ncbi:hypothetical protein H4R18_002020 [Coemansia javaensis]|uniref:HCP-like protein n=1 Tax=Coemansia javaensis TaxID=2761396 RepID=A0A9W8LIB6_9FUNG|nr:hypothetical protein H4R18_002020 [Coemansia javaensis]
MSYAHATAPPLGSAPSDSALQAPVAEFAGMSVRGSPPQSAQQPQPQPQQQQQQPALGGSPSAYPQPAPAHHVQSPASGPLSSPDDAGFDADVHSGFDGQGQGYYAQAGYQQPPQIVYRQQQSPQIAYQQQQQSPQIAYQQQQASQQASQQAPPMFKSHSEMSRQQAAMHAQTAQQYAANYQSHPGSASSAEGGSSSSIGSAPQPGRLSGPGGLHPSASQPRLGDSVDDMGYAPRPRQRPGRAGQLAGAGGAGGEPNPFLTYSRNSIYSSSQTSLNQRGSVTGLGAGAGSASRRMSRTLVSGNNGLDTYREAAKKTQDERIQMEYARFLLQSIENLDDPTAREEIDVTYSVYLPGSDPTGSAAASSASLPLGQQASEVDPENRKNLIAEAVYWIKHLQRKGNTEASYIAGTWFETGRYGIEMDRSKAVQLYTYAAKNHHGPAAYKVAVYYEERKSGGRAFSYYQMAAALGDVGANYRMARVFLDGDFHKKPNIKQALVYLRRSADLANAECHEGAFLLGQMYLKRYPDPAVYEVVFYDPEEAQRLIDKAARLGNVEAQYMLGHMFEFGEDGFPVDPHSSTHYYHLAADQDHAKAQMALSGWYLSGGDGVPIDDRMAFDWGHRAAQQGLTRAIFAMGYYYEMGIGCEADVARARDWYERAAAAGSEEARERLQKGIGAETTPESKAALRRHVTQKRQKAASSSTGRGKKRAGLLSRDKDGGKDGGKDKDKDKCIVM